MVVTSSVHLDQVLLAGQSMPVAQQNEDLHAADLAEGHGLAAGCVDERDTGYINPNGIWVRHWHGSPFRTAGGSGRRDRFIIWAARDGRLRP